MKSLKLDHRSAQAVAQGLSTTTWRINDDKDLHVNDIVNLIDKQDPSDPSTWTVFGRGVIVSVLEKQLGKVTQSDLLPNEKLPPLPQLLKEFRSYYGAQVGAETPVKIIRFTFSAGDEADPNANPHLDGVRLFADGGSRGNPGPSASGYLLVDHLGAVIAQNGLYLGVTTNNQAEYQALKLGLEAAQKLGVRSLDVYMDSMLVINQVKGVYKVKNTDLRPLHQAVVDLAGKFAAITFTHVPRERNKQADAIVNQILDAA